MEKLKTVSIASLITAALVGGGTYVLDQTQVAQLNSEITAKNEQVVTLIAEIDAQKAVKESAADAYLYAMISSGRKPALDVMPLNDLEASYLRVVGDNIKISDKNLFNKGVNIAASKGDYVCEKI